MSISVTFKSLRICTVIPKTQGFDVAQKALVLQKKMNSEIFTVDLIESQMNLFHIDQVSRTDYEEYHKNYFVRDGIILMALTVFLGRTESIAQTLAALTNGKDFSIVFDNTQAVATIRGSESNSIISLRLTPNSTAQIIH